MRNVSARDHSALYTVALTALCGVAAGCAQYRAKTVWDRPVPVFAVQDNDMYCPSYMLGDMLHWITKKREHEQKYGVVLTRLSSGEHYVKCEAGKFVSFHHGDVEVFEKDVAYSKIVSAICAQAGYEYRYMGNLLLIAPDFHPERLTIEEGGQATMAYLDSLVGFDRLDGGLPEELEEVLAGTVSHGHLNAPQKIECHVEGEFPFKVQLYTFAGPVSFGDVLRILTQVAPLECRVQENGVRLIRLASAQPLPSKTPTATSSARGRP